MNPPEQLLTVKRFAELTSLTEKYVRQLLQEGKLRRLKLGDSKQGRIRIPASEIGKIFHETTVRPRPKYNEPDPVLLARAVARAEAMGRKAS